MPDTLNNVLHISMNWHDWLQLFLHYMMLSLLSIGGAISTLPDMHRYLVAQQGWLSDAQFNASVSIAQAAPGPNVLFIAPDGLECRHECRWYVDRLAGGSCRHDGHTFTQYHPDICRRQLGPRQPRTAQCARLQAGHGTYCHRAVAGNRLDHGSLSRPGQQGLAFVVDDGSLHYRGLAHPFAFAVVAGGRRSAGLVRPDLSLRTSFPYGNTVSLSGWNKFSSCLSIPPSASSM